MDFLGVGADKSWAQSLSELSPRNQPGNGHARSSWSGCCALRERLLKRPAQYRVQKQEAALAEQNDDRQVRRMLQRRGANHGTEARGLKRDHISSEREGDDDFHNPRCTRRSPPTPDCTSTPPPGRRGCGTIGWKRGGSPSPPMTGQRIPGSGPCGTTVQAAQGPPKTGRQAPRRGQRQTFDCGTWSVISGRAKTQQPPAQRLRPDFRVRHEQSCRRRARGRANRRSGLRRLLRDIRRTGLPTPCWTTLSTGARSAARPILPHPEQGLRLNNNVRELPI